MRSIRYISVCISVLMLSGCMVAESKYLKKAEDVVRLTKSLTDLTVKHEKLAAENTALTGTLSKTNEDNRLLLLKKAELEQLLKSKPETLSTGMGELRQKVSDMEAENRMLRASSESIQRLREKKLRDSGNAYEQLLQAMKHEISHGLVAVSEMRGRLTITIQSGVLFQPNQALITPKGAELLHKTANILKKFTDRPMRVYGHTDNRPTAPAMHEIYPSNWELAALMAVNVARHLQQSGVNQKMLSATAFADNRPVADNSNEEGQLRNRRVEIIVTVKE